MVQLVIDNIFIDLYEEEPIKLNYSIEDITDTSTRSVYSRTFRVPSTANNNDCFKHAFEVNGIDFDITQRRDAYIYVNGDLAETGEIRLNKIYNSRNGERIDYELLFLGEVRDFASSVGEGSLCDIDTSDLVHDFDFANITGSWQAYPEGTSTDGLLDGNVLYPLIDHGNTYDDSGNIEQARIENGGSGSDSFTTGGGSGSALKNLQQNRFKPMIRSKWLWDKIFSDAGYTYESSFLGSDEFLNLYTSAFGSEASINVGNPETSNTFYVSYDKLAGGEQYITLGTEYLIEYDNKITDPSNLFSLSTSQYTVPLTDPLYKFGFKIYVSFTSPQTGAQDFIIRIKRNSGGVITNLYSNTFTSYAFADQVMSDSFSSGTLGYYSLNALDKIYLTIETVDPLDIAVVDQTSHFRLDEAPGQMYLSSFLDCDYKKIDFIKDIVTKYRLVMAPVKNRSKHFKIEPWSDYVATGDIFDWTDKLDLSKDFILEPIFFTQKSKILFRDKSDDDYLNALYFDTFGEPIGSYDLVSTNELITGERKIETNLSTTPVNQIEGATSTQMDNTIIPQLHVHEATDTGIQHLPIKPRTRFLYYNGIQDTGSQVGYNKTWYMLNDVNASVGYSNFPMVSPYSDWPVVSNTQYFDWEREDGYIQFDQFDSSVGISMYENYWSDYIENLYNKWSRRLTAYFVLSSEDLKEFSFDDVIFVKDTYYYVEKITDVVVGDKTSVKVQLIKLLDFQVPSTGFVPPTTIWNEVSSNWNATPETWNAI